MNKLSFTAILLMFFIVAHALSPACADNTPYRSIGKTIRPVDDDVATLAAMDIRLVIDDAEAGIHAAFYILNESAPDTVTVGFTREWESDIEDFHVFAGSELPVDDLTESPIAETGDRPEWWKVFYVPVNREVEVTEVVTEYTVPLHPVGNRGFEDMLFTFDLTAGAHWRGSIEDARITVYFNGIDIDRILALEPEGFSRDNNRITWHISDFEPSEDIVIRIMQIDQFYALETAITTLETDPGNAHAHYLAGRVFFLRSQFDDRTTGERARTELERAIMIDPAHLDARFLLAVAYHYDDDRIGVEEQLRAIIEIDPLYICGSEILNDSFFPPIPSRSPSEWLEALEER